MKVRKCQQCGKTIYNTREQARTGMMRVISHDPHADMFNLHTYECPHNKNKYHFGHEKYFRNNDTVSLVVD